MLQGAPVVTMRLATDVSHQEVPGASAQLQGTWEPINEQEGQRRRTYEEHLRESSDAIRRWNKAARDEDGNSVSGSDLDERSAGSSDSESPVPQRKRPAARGAAVPPPKERTRVDDFLARQQTRPELPVKRTRIVDFVTEEATGIGGRVPEVDLSRFGSDSDDDGGEPLRIRGRHIPQVDGAADTSSDETSDSESEGGGNTSSSSESGAESSSSDSENGNNGEDKGPDRREEEAMETDIGDSAGTLGQAALASSSAADRMPTGDEEDVTWMAALLPAGAAFFRRDPVAQVEASWRARREGATREYKELRRMALRQTRQRSGAKGQR